MISAISDRNLSSFPYDLGASGAKNRFFLPNHKDSLFFLSNHKVRGGPPHPQGGGAKDKERDFNSRFSYNYFAPVSFPLEFVFTSL